MFPCVSFRANAHVTVLLVLRSTFPIVLTRPFETLRLKKTYNNSVDQHKSPIILCFLFLQIESVSLSKLCSLITKILCKSPALITPLPTSAINHNVLLPLPQETSKEKHMAYTDARLNQLAFKRIIKQIIKNLYKQLSVIPLLFLSQKESERFFISNLLRYYSDGDSE